MLYKTIVIVAFLFCCPKGIFSNTIVSSQNGYWNDSTTWKGNIVPTDKDSIIIKHYIIFNQNLIINSGGYLFIDSIGTLCGLYNVRVLCGSYFYNYGKVQADSVFISDGGNFGFIQFLKEYEVKPCRITTPVGAALGGVAFSCSFPLGIKELDDNNGLSVYPNPSSTFITVEFQNERMLTYHVHFYSLVSTCVLSLMTNKNKVSIDVSGFSKGVYFVEIENDGIIGRKKVIVE